MTRTKLAVVSIIIQMIILYCVFQNTDHPGERFNGAATLGICLFTAIFFIATHWALYVLISSFLRVTQEQRNILRAVSIIVTLFWPAVLLIAAMIAYIVNH